MLDHDSEDNTDHAQFRQYANTQGRWLSPDPYAGSYDTANPQSFNRYAYVANVLLSFFDPSGPDVNCPPNNQSKSADGGPRAMVNTCNCPWDTCVVVTGGGGDGGDGSGGGGTGGGSGCGSSGGGMQANVILDAAGCGGGGGGGGGKAPNNGECDNACQLAHAFNKTGLYSLTSVCSPVAFYGASAAGATGAVAVANAPEVYAATVGDYATWYGRAVSWLSRMVGKTPSGAGTAIAAAPAAISQFCSSH